MEIINQPINTQAHRCRTCERLIPLTDSHCDICSKTIDEYRQHSESWDTKHYLTRDK